MKAAFMSLETRVGSEEQGKDSRFRKALEEQLLVDPSLSARNSHS